jgi:N-methylhydantoinase A/oxoprolinase/acetone carboxylase beta subunit
MTAPRRIRVGVDTGGTFTDVVAFDEDTGELAAIKTPSTPADPAEGFLDGVAKVLATLGVGAEAITAICHGTTVATNQLLEGKVGRLGFITTEGYRGPARDRPPERPRRLRQQLLLGQAAPDRPRRPGQDRRRPPRPHRR